MIKENNPWTSKPNIETQKPPASKGFRFTWSSTLVAIIIGLLIIRQLWEWFPVLELMIKGIWK